MKLKRGIVTAFIAIIVCSVFCSSCGQNSAKDMNGFHNTDKETYQQKKESLAEHEANNPTEFLTAGGTYHFNLINQLVINGTVSNKATTVIYKDVQILVRFYTTTETLLDTKTYVIYDYFSPNNVKSFTLRINDAPAACKKVGWDIVGAVSK